MQIPALEELGLGRRSLLAIIAVMVALLLLFLFSVSEHAAGQQPDEVRLYEGIPLDASLLRLDKQVLEDAYKEYVGGLFNVWLKGSLRSNAEIVNGLKNARRAYNIAAAQIAQREQQILLEDRRRQEEQRR